MGGKGKGKGKGLGKGLFGGPGPLPHHRHHWGPRPGVLAAEAAVVGAAVAGTAAVASAIARPPLRPHPRRHIRPVRAAQVVVVAETSRPAEATRQPRPARCNRAGSAQIAAVATAAPPQTSIDVASINMLPAVVEVRGGRQYFGVDVTSTNGAMWRVWRCYSEFCELSSKIGSSAQDAPFPRNPDRSSNDAPSASSVDRRHDFGPAFPPRCAQCGQHSYNRGDRASGTVYCLDCYNVIFPDAGALQSFLKRLEIWLQSILQCRNSAGPWTEPLRGFLEAGRTSLAVQGAKAISHSGYGSAPGPLAPMPTAATTSPLQPEASAEEPHQTESQESEQVYSIDIPAGVVAGQTLAITVADGSRIEFTVPPDQKAGDQLYLFYDVAAGSLSVVGDGTPQPLPATSHAAEYVTISIEVPTGVCAGQTLAITVPDGRQIELTVPVGKKSGDRMDMCFDAVTGTLTPLEDTCPKPQENDSAEADRVMSIQVPEGVAAGQVIAVPFPGGRQIEVTVPVGKSAGDQLDLWFDAEAGSLQPLT